MNGPLLEVRDLQTSFFTDDGEVPAVRDVSFTMMPGEVLGLVGESGCGKSVTSLSLMRLLSPPGRTVGGQVLLEGRDLLGLTEREMQEIRGNKISMIFQEPMTSLNPVMRIGTQIAESLMLHRGKSRREAQAEAVSLLADVRIPDPEQRAVDYPHRLSGGMRQRVMIAMAIACRPQLLIADEPTTALDVTIQAEILALLDSLRKTHGLSILLITHALAVVAEIADRVIVMYAGRIVEEAPVAELFADPRHPYTVGLLESIPRIVVAGEKKERLKTIEGSVPDLRRLPPGCSFCERCKDRMEKCSTGVPPFVWINGRHRVACWKY